MFRYRLYAAQISMGYSVSHGGFGRNGCPLGRHMALKIDLGSHLKDVEVAVAGVVIDHGVDVIKHQLRVEVEIPVQAESDIVLLAPVGDVVLQIDTGEPGLEAIMAADICYSELSPSPVAATKESP
ncbi:MAG: hypothetical protein ABIF19_08620 [Planctomycetota bacterium]